MAASVWSRSAWVRQGYDFQLTHRDEQGWRATFYTSGMEHPITSALTAHRGVANNQEDDRT